MQCALQHIVSLHHERLVLGFTTESEVEQLFSLCGTISSISFVPNKAGRFSIYVCFAAVSDALVARQRERGRVTICGWVLRVQAITIELFRKLLRNNIAVAVDASAAAAAAAAATTGLAAAVAAAELAAAVRLAEIAADSNANPRSVGDSKGRRSSSRGSLASSLRGGDGSVASGPAATGSGGGGSVASGLAATGSGGGGGSVASGLAATGSGGGGGSVASGPAATGSGGGGSVASGLAATGSGVVEQAHLQVCNPVQRGDGKICAATAGYGRNDSDFAAAVGPGEVGGSTAAATQQQQQEEEEGTRVAAASSSAAAPAVTPGRSIGSAAASTSYGGNADIAAAGGPGAGEAGGTTAAAAHQQQQEEEEGKRAATRFAAALAQAGVWPGVSSNWYLHLHYAVQHIISLQHQKLVPGSTTEMEIEQLFSPCGAISSISFVPTKAGSRLSIYVCFAAVSGAVAARQREGGRVKIRGQAMGVQAITTDLFRNLLLMNVPAAVDAFAAAAAVAASTGLAAAAAAGSVIEIAADSHGQSALIGDSNSRRSSSSGSLACSLSCGGGSAASDLAAADAAEGCGHGGGSNSAAMPHCIAAVAGHGDPGCSRGCSSGTVGKPEGSGVDRCTCNAVSGAGGNSGSAIPAGSTVADNGSSSLGAGGMDWRMVDPSGTAGDLSTIWQVGGVLPVPGDEEYILRAVYMHCLPAWVTGGEVKTALGRFGPIKSIGLKPSKSKQSVCVVVEFTAAASATAALAQRRVRLRGRTKGVVLPVPKKMYGKVLMWDVTIAAYPGFGGGAGYPSTSSNNSRGMVKGRLGSTTPMGNLRSTHGSGSPGMIIDSAATGWSVHGWSAPWAAAAAMVVGAFLGLLVGAIAPGPN